MTSDAQEVETAFATKLNQPCNENIDPPQAGARAETKGIGEPASETAHFGELLTRELNGHRVLRDTAPGENALVHEAAPAA